MENPYSVITGIINTSYQDTSKYQTNLGVKAVFHPNPLVVFLLIKVSIDAISQCSYKQLL